MDRKRYCGGRSRGGRDDMPPPKVPRLGLATDSEMGARMDMALKTESITKFRRLTTVHFRNPINTTCAATGVRCETCVSNPVATLNCDCEEAGTAVCAECKPRVLRDHPCFQRGWVCSLCSATGLETVARLGCCGVVMCEECVGKVWYREAQISGKCNRCGARTTGSFYQPLKISRALKPHVPTRRVIPKAQRHISVQLLAEIRRCSLGQVDIMALFGDHGNMMEEPPPVPAHLLAPKVLTYTDLVRMVVDRSSPRCHLGTCAARGVRGWRCGFEAPVLFPGMDECLFCTIRAQEQSITQLVLNGVVWEGAPTAGTYHMSVWLDPTTVAITPIMIGGIDTFSVEFEGHIGGYHPERFYRLEDVIRGSRWIDHGENMGLLDLSGLDGRRVPKNIKSRGIEC
ncbi:ORF78 [black bullhead herpesvirus]|uniref:ORF78 n=1 Tax=black bullhead herpesvirus TaxID=508441 RepID=A0A2H5AJL1_9VIRU|nr:ORF78 [black bullhead herpesvirus]AUG72324.1 ORF78 [black bullhead herpesvirus]